MENLVKNRYYNCGDSYIIRLLVSLLRLKEEVWTIEVLNYHTSISRDGSNSSNSGNYAKVNTDNNNSSSLDDVDDKQNVNKNDEDTIEL